MRRPETETTHELERDDGTILNLTVRGDVEPFLAGNRRGHRDTWEPDEGGTASVRSAKDEDGEEWTCRLTAIEMTSLEEALVEQAGMEHGWAAEAAAEARGEDERGW